MYGTEPGDWTTQQNMAPIRAWSAPAGAAVLVGDSRASGWMGQGKLVSTPLVGYGFPGITMGDLQAYLGTIMAFAPSHIFVQVGVNICWPWVTAAQIAAQGADFCSLLGFLKGLGPKIVITTPVGLEQGGSYLAANGYTSAQVVTMSQAVRGLADVMLYECAAQGVACCDLGASGIMGCADTTAKATMTGDGVHFSADGWNTAAFWMSKFL